MIHIDPASWSGAAMPVQSEARSIGTILGSLREVAVLRARAPRCSTRAKTAAALAHPQSRDAPALRLGIG